MTDFHDYNYLPISADFIAHSLLRMPDGQDFTNSVKQLQEALSVYGEGGHNLLCRALLKALYRSLRKDAERLDNPRLASVLSLISSFDALWAELLDCCYPSRQPNVNEGLLISQNVEMLRWAEKEEDLATCWKKLRKALLRQKESCLLDGKDLIEWYLAKYLAEDLAQVPDLSPETDRDLELFQFLHSNQPIKQSLVLVAAHHGHLLLLTPHNIHLLNGSHDDAFLRRELDRLSRQLPLLDFLKLLSAMNNEEHPSNTVAEGVLNNLCEKLQVMLGPVK